MPRQVGTLIIVNTKEEANLINGEEPYNTSYCERYAVAYLSSIVGLRFCRIEDCYVGVRHKGYDAMLYEHQRNI